MNLQRKATLTIGIESSKKKIFRKTSKKSTAIQKKPYTAFLTSRIIKLYTQNNNFRVKSVE